MMATMGRDESDPRRRWRQHLGWPAVLLAGWLLYECTAQPAVGVVVACAKFGWADAGTAWWLRRVDPDRRRGAACFWWYLAFGLWKVALTATLTMVLVCFVGDIVGARAAPNAPVPSIYEGALLAAAAGFGLSFLFSYVAMWAALRNGIRVWLGVAPHRARAGRFWPPYHGQTNFASYVTYTTMVLTVVAALAAPSIPLAVFGWQPQHPVLCWLIFFLGLGTMGSTVIVFQALTSRLVARSPRDCWPPESDECALQLADYNPG
jgi:hypothetical protein